MDCDDSASTLHWLGAFWCALKRRRFRAKANRETPNMRRRWTRVYHRQLRGMLRIGWLNSESSSSDMQIAKLKSMMNFESPFIEIERKIEDRRDRRDACIEQIGNLQKKAHCFSARTVGRWTFVVLSRRDSSVRCESHSLICLFTVFTIRCLDYSQHGRFTACPIHSLSYSPHTTTQKRCRDASFQKQFQKANEFLQFELFS